MRQPAGTCRRPRRGRSSARYRSPPPSFRRSPPTSLRICSENGKGLFYRGGRRGRQSLRSSASSAVKHELRHRRVALLSERIVQLLERNRQAHIVAVRPPLRVSTRRKNRVGRATVLPNQPSEIAEAVCRQPEPECALAEHEIDARRWGAGIGELT